MTKVVCFDLEGPLSPQDNAYEVLGLIDDGHMIFEAISRYDDILTLEKRKGYEPGDTLSLIVPFLIHHGITEEDIKKVSDAAKIVDGVKYTIDWLKETGWDPYIISTSYQQHALNIAGKIGIAKEKVYCTRLSLDRYVKELMGLDSQLMEEAERDILDGLYPNLDDEKRLKERLDRFFWKDLSKTGLGKAMKEVRVVGGQRKLDAACDIAKKTGKRLEEFIVVGDSITDYKMLGGVRDAGGVSVVFNGNEFCIPYGVVGLASTDMRLLLILTAAHERTGKAGVIETATEWEKRREEFLQNPVKIPKEHITEDVRDFLEEKENDKNFMQPFFHLLEGADENKQEEVLRIHKKARSVVRGDAAKLG